MIITLAIIMRLTYETAGKLASATSAIQQLFFHLRKAVAFGSRLFLAIGTEIARIAVELFDGKFKVSLAPGRHHLAESSPIEAHCSSLSHLYGSNNCIHEIVRSHHKFRHDPALSSFFLELIRIVRRNLPHFNEAVRLTD